MNTAITSVITLGAAAAISFLVVYWTGARWWSNRIGRAIVAQGIGIALILCYVAFRRLTLPHPPLTDHVGQVALSLYGLIAVIELFLAISFWRELRARRHARHWRKPD